MKTKLTCLLCHCLISVVDGDKSRFDDHMKNEHDVRYDFESLLVLSVMTPAERKIFTGEFNKKLKDRISNRPTDIKMKVFKSSYEVTREVDDEVDLNIDDRIDHEIEHKIDEKNIDCKKEEENENPRPEPRPAVPEGREGVLKCKLCPRYIKQSQMKKHKEEIHRQTERTSSDVSTELLLLDQSGEGARLELEQNAARIHPSNEIKRKSTNSSKDVDKVPKRIKEDDDGDEDWTVKNKTKVRLPCRYCSKKFGSKFSVTAHERKVHVSR